MNTFKKSLFLSYLKNLITGLLVFFLISPSFVFADTNPIVEIDENFFVADIVHPSQVAVIQHVAVKAEIAPFLLNIGTLSVASSSETDPSLVGNDYYLMRSGVIVTPSGDIITNAKAVSDTSIKLAIVTPVVTDAILKAITDAKDSETSSDEELITMTAAEQFEYGRKIIEHVMSNTVFEITKDVVVVPRVDFAEEQLEVKSLFEKGISADVIYVNDDFYKDGYDIAHIKIGDGPYPSIALSKKASLAGEVVYAENAPTVKKLMVGEPVEDLKRTTIESVDEDMFTLPLSLSQESSGGAVVNAKGELVGIMTMDVGNEELVAVLSGRIVRDILDRSEVVPSFGEYAESLIAGVEFAKTASCEEAQVLFDKASINTDSFVRGIHTSVYLEKCLLAQEQLNAGFMNFDISGIFGTSDIPFLSIILGILAVLFVITLVGVIIWYKSKSKKKDERSVEEQIASASSQEIDIPTDVVTLTHAGDGMNRPLQSLPDIQPTEKSAHNTNIDLSETKSEKVATVVDSNQLVLKKKIKVNTEHKNTAEGVVDKMHASLMQDMPKDQLGQKVSEMPKAVEFAKIKKEEESTKPQPLTEELEGVPNQDHEKLAALWPGKYSEKRVQDSVAEVKSHKSVEKKSTPVTVSNEVEEVHSQKVVADSADVDDLLAGLLTYIADTRKLGFNDITIIQELRKSGWDEEDIKKAFIIANQS